MTPVEWVMAGVIAFFWLVLGHRAFNHVILAPVIGFPLGLIMWAAGASLLDLWSVQAFVGTLIVANLITQVGVAVIFD